jgi:exosortase A
VHVDPQLQQHVEAAEQPQRLSPAFIVIGSALFVFAWYWPTTWSMVQIWHRSETFAHGFLVVPLFAYLVWLRRAELAALPARPFLPALLGVAAMGFAWLLGELASAIGVSQAAVVATIPFVIWAVLGTRMLWALAFPLAILAFAVPVGEFLVPTLIDRTADFTVLALRATGIPVYREGNHFMIPSGSWSVVEACSGLRYLIASALVGLMYAYLMYRSTRKRVLFMLAAIAVPIIANWLRAYLIVMLGHLSGNRLAAGVDHLIYGWVFFGIVIFIMFWVGARWREDGGLAALRGAGSAPPQPPPTFDRRIPVAAVAALVLVLVWRPAAAVLDGRNVTGVPNVAAIPAAGGWVDADSKPVAFRPDYQRPSSERVQTFRRGGDWAGVYVGFYRNQGQGAELVNSMNTIAGGEGKAWRRVASGSKAVEFGTDAVSVEVAEVKDPAHHLVAWRWYWIDGELTANDYVAKGRLALTKLLGRGDDSAVVLVYAERRDDRAASDRVLQAFVTDMWPGIERTLHETRNRGRQ